MFPEKECSNATYHSSCLEEQAGGPFDLGVVHCASPTLATNNAMGKVPTAQLLLFLTAVAVLRPAQCNAKDCHEEYPWLNINCEGERVSEPCWDECMRRHPNRIRASCLSWSRYGLPQTFCSCTFPCH
uniref:Uncharacterized protein n=1 Tax=Kalanchoe fedtschenkoi TaxID=63787 RepID=A0A7N0T3T3_KALFE